MVISKFKTARQMITAPDSNILVGRWEKREDREAYCARVAERYADQFAYHFLKWFIEEEGLGINPTGTDIESYIHDFKETLR